MQKQRIDDSSQLDALIAVANRLSLNESRCHISSQAFFERYTKGRFTDEAEFVEWANDYLHYRALRAEVERKLQNRG